MTSSFNMVSIKVKWQIEANKYNTSKQDMHYEKISADFILFLPYGLVVMLNIKSTSFWGMKKSHSSYLHRFFSEFFLYSLSLSFTDSCVWILPVESNVFSNSTLYQKDKL